MTSRSNSRVRRVWPYGLLALGALLYLSLPFVSTTPQVRDWALRTASSITGYQVKFEAFRIGYDLSLTVQALTVAKSEEAPFLSVGRVRVAWLTTSLLSGRLGSIDVDGPRLYVARLPSAKGEAGADNASLPIGRMNIREGFVEYPVDGRITALGPLDLSVDSIRAGANFDLEGRSEIADGGGEVVWSVQVGSDLDTVSGRARLRIHELRSVVTALGPMNVPEAAGATSGSLSVSFAGSLRRGMKVRGDATLRHPALPQPVEMSGNGSVAALTNMATLQLQMKLQPDLPALDIAGRLARDAEDQPTIDAELDWDAVALEGPSRLLDVPLDNVNGRFSLKAAAHGLLADPTIRGTLTIEKAALTGSSWNASGSLVAPFRLDGATLLTVDAGIQLTQWAGSVASFDWKIDAATVAASLDVTDGEMTLSATKLAVAGLQFHDADYLRAGEGMTLRGPVRARLDSAGSLRLDVDVAATAGELLWERFYTRLASYSPRLRGVIDVSALRVSSSGLELTLEGIGKVNVRGSYDGASTERSLQADIDVFRLDALYEVAVREALREAYPLFERTSVNGRAAATIDYRENGARRRLSGNVELENVEVTALEPSLEVRGLSLAVPLELGENLPPSEPRTGLLRVAAMKIGGVEAVDVAIPLTVGPNHLSIANSVRIPLLGGSLFLADFGADRLAGPDPRARFSMQLQEIDLGELSTALAWPRLKGTVSGAIPRVTVESDEIRSEGEIRAGLFGGEARVRDLRVSQLFSPVPALELNLEFEDISLGQMTETLEVGHVSGVVRGRVEKLEIVHGEPVRFDAWMETVSRPDVPQRVSVTAIRQLSILGGSGGDPLSHGILSFFDEYRYAKMGFRCNLRNDRFTLHGIEAFDGKDYLVVGSVMPPRVNVISHNQTISFSQMIRRLERALATTSEEQEPSKDGQS